MAASGVEQPPGQVISLMNGRNPSCYVGVGSIWGTQIDMNTCNIMRQCYVAQSTLKLCKYWYVYGSVYMYIIVKII